MHRLLAFSQQKQWDTVAFIANHKRTLVRQSIFKNAGRARRQFHGNQWLKRIIQLYELGWGPKLPFDQHFAVSRSTVYAFLRVRRVAIIDDDNSLTARRVSQAKNTTDVLWDLETRRDNHRAGQVRLSSAECFLPLV